MNMMNMVNVDLVVQKRQINIVIVKWNIILIIDKILKQIVADEKQDNDDTKYVRKNVNYDLKLNIYQVLEMTITIKIQILIHHKF